MNRELTLREKVLLLILIVLVMVLGYFKLLYEPVSDRIARCREDTAQEQLALEQNAVKLAQMEKMEQALADIRAAGGSKAIPPQSTKRSSTSSIRLTPSARRCCASCAACSRARGNTPSISATARRSRAISSCAPSP